MGCQRQVNKERDNVVDSKSKLLTIPIRSHKEHLFSKEVIIVRKTF